MGPFLGSMGVDTLLECGVWLNIATAVGLNAIVRSHDAFAMHQNTLSRLFTENCMTEMHEYC